MASIREYFDKAFTYVLTASRRVLVQTSGDEVEVIVQIHLDFDAPSKYLSLFVPRHERWIEVCQFVLGQCFFLLRATGDVNVKLPPSQYIYGGFSVLNGDPVEIKALPLCEPAIADQDLPFSGTVFIYSENEASQEQVEALRHLGRSLGVRVRWRGLDFAHERSLIEKPVAFISCDTRDKRDIARPLAIKLGQMLCPVWFDEFSLSVGDSLREKIEKGLRECTRCILILSLHFLANRGWTKTEFNSVFTREILQKENVMLPVWCGVTVNDVYEYSPSLADKLGLDWNFRTRRSESPSLSEHLSRDVAADRRQVERQIIGL